MNAMRNRWKTYLLHCVILLCSIGLMTTTHAARKRRNRTQKHSRTQSQPRINLRLQKAITLTKYGRFTVSVNFSNGADGVMINYQVRDKRGRSYAKWQAPGPYACHTDEILAAIRALKVGKATVGWKVMIQPGGFCRGQMILPQVRTHDNTIVHMISLLPRQRQYIFQTLAGTHISLHPGTKQTVLHVFEMVGPAVLGLFQPRKLAVAANGRMQWLTIPDKNIATLIQRAYPSDACMAQRFLLHRCLQQEGNDAKCKPLQTREKICLAKQQKNTQTHSRQFSSCNIRANNDLSAKQRCLQQELEKQDIRLNKAYQGLRKLFSDSELMLPMHYSQRLWTRFRDSACHLRGQYPKGPDQTLRVLQCRLEQTDRRADELQEMLAAGQ